MASTSISVGARGELQKLHIFDRHNLINHAPYFLGPRSDLLSMLVYRGRIFFLIYVDIVVKEVEVVSPIGVPNQRM